MRGKTAGFWGMYDAVKVTSAKKQWILKKESLREEMTKAGSCGASRLLSKYTIKTSRDLEAVGYA